MKDSASAVEINAVEKTLGDYGFQTHPIYGEKKTVIGAIGDKRLLSMNQILTMDGVENVVPIMKPYKLASKELHKEPSVIDVGHGITVGGEKLAVFAGPCAIESQEQFTLVSAAVKASGANILRGGAFKPRSSRRACVKSSEISWSDKLFSSTIREREIKAELTSKYGFSVVAPTSTTTRSYTA